MHTSLAAGRTVAMIGVGTALHSLAIASRACSTCALFGGEIGWTRFRVGRGWGEGGERGLRRFRIASPEPPHPTFSPTGRRSERPCVPESDHCVCPRPFGEG